MADRKVTPSVLDELLGGAPAPEAQDTSIPVRQYTSKPVRHPAGKPARQSTSKPVGQPASKTATEEKPKATYYLSPEAIESLDEAWLTLRKMARPRDRAHISKSWIVEQAILLAVEELRESGAESRLASQIDGG